MRTFFAVCALAACAARPRGLPPSSAQRFDVEAPVLMGPVEAVAAAAGVLAWSPLSDGARATLRADGALTLDLDDRPVAQVRVQRPERCVLAPWGARAVAFCADDGVEASTLGASIPRLVVLRADASQWVPSRDGRTLTRRGACEPSDADASVMVACSLEPDGRWREWRTDAPGALLDRHGAYALVTRCARDAPCAVSLFAIDLAQWRPVLLPDPAARCARASTPTGGSLGSFTRALARPSGGSCAARPRLRCARCACPSPSTTAPPTGPTGRCFCAATRRGSPTTEGSRCGRSAGGATARLRRGAPRPSAWGRALCAPQGCARSREPSKCDCLGGEQAYRRKFLRRVDAFQARGRIRLWPTPRFW